VFGSALSQQTLRLSNVGTGTVTVLPQDIVVSELTPWLGVTPTSIDATGMGDYAVTVDRTGLAEGSYNATIDITSDAPNPDVTVTITMRVILGSPDADAGVHYVILVDGNGNTVANNFDVVSVNNGEYSYVISNVPPGQYRVFAGTDSDDDAFLCDAGEACGTYGTLDSPDPIAVNGVDMTGIDFTSEFRVNLGTLGATASGGGTAASSATTPIPIPKTELTSEQKR
jgi:serine protease